MLTALSVGRECGLVSAGDTIMEVKVDERNSSISFEATTPSTVSQCHGDCQISLDFIHNIPHTGLEKTQGLKKTAVFFFLGGGGL